MCYNKYIKKRKKRKVSTAKYKKARYGEYEKVKENG